MPFKLKPLSEQVLVVTGATSGVGLATAREAAKAGASVVLTACDEAQLRRVSDELAAAGGRVHPVAADLSHPEGAAKVTRTAMARFGGLDAWVNTAGEGGHLAVVNGSEAAADWLRAEGRSGAVINVGASPSDTKGFTDALRVSLRRVKAPVSVSLVRRTGAPQAVALAILYALQHPVQDLSVGPRGRRLTAAEQAGLAVGMGALALAVAAAYLARGRIARTTRPLLARAARRPAWTQGLAARGRSAATKLLKAPR